ncbi:MAG: class I SAM-dependent methyltransferase [Desulfobaccales bacterium]|nr:class I SAM-dependent methyltransferase [Desulfobaccales bacterium]
MSRPRKSHPKCLLCGQEGRPVLAGLFDDRFGAPGLYDIVKCPSCGLEQTWPRPSERQLKELYERFYNYGGEAGTTYTKLRERLMASPLYQLWLKADGDISFHMRSGAGRLLDVGCNEGRGLTLYAGQGFQAEGLELNEQAAAQARKRGFTVHTQALAKFTPQRPYEVVVLANVLEHVRDPVAMLSKVRRLLSSGGQVWISCPNAAGFWRRLFGRHWINWHVPFHLWHFSPQSLKEVLVRADFELIEIKTCTPALWLAQSLCVALAARAGRANRVMRSAPVIAGLMLAARGLLHPWLGNLDRQMQGDCLIVTAGG